MGILTLVIVFIGMYFAADFGRRQAQSFTASIQPNWLRVLADAFAWGLSASVAGLILGSLLGMAVPFFNWLTLFTVIDFVFGMIRSNR